MGNTGIGWKARFDVLLTMQTFALLLAGATCAECVHRGSVAMMHAGDISHGGRDVLSKTYDALAKLLLAFNPSTRLHQAATSAVHSGTRDAGRHNQAQMVTSRPSLYSGLPLSGLPPLIAAAREAVSWPTNPAAHPPMFYAPLDILPEMRLSNAIPLSTPAAALAENVDAAIASLGGSDHARVAVALLLLAGGGTDECHDLVTPLSWDSPTHFSGPPVRNSPAHGEAHHAHALVHRKEAFHNGEFGTGFHNSGFWYGGVRGASAEKRFSKMRELSIKVAANDLDKQKWINTHLAQNWSPQNVNELIQSVLRDQLKGESNWASLKTFAGELAIIELHVLLDECLEKCLDDR